MLRKRDRDALDRRELFALGHSLDMIVREQTVEFDYAYDEIGNRETSAVDGSTRVYTTNDLNQYYDVSNPIQVNSYDVDGNLLWDSRYSYVWDGENRLIQVTRIQLEGHIRTRVSYAYDYLGRMVRRHVETRDETQQPLTWQTESVTVYVYDGWRMILELDALDEDAPRRSHYWGLDLSGTLDGAAGIGGLLATVDHDTPITYFVLCDGHGNVTQLVHASDGSEAAEFEYDPYGNRIDTRPDQPLPFGFSTKFLDPETGLYYYGYRWYQPSWGRWLSRDPIAEQGGLNLYLFLRNNPVGMLDKDGRMAVAVLAAPGAALGPLGGLVIVGTLTVWLSYNIDWARAWSDLIEAVRSLDPRKWRCFCRVRNPVFKTCPRPLFTTPEQAADDYVPKYTQYMGPFVQLPFLHVSVYQCAAYSAAPTKYPGVYIRLNVVYVKSGMEVSKPISYSIRCCACCKLFRASVCCEALHQSGEDKDRRPEFPERDSPFPVLPPRP